MTTLLETACLCEEIEIVSLRCLFRWIEIFSNDVMIVTESWSWYIYIYCTFHYDFSFFFFTTFDILMATWFSCTFPVTHDLLLRWNWHTPSPRDALCISFLHFRLFYRRLLLLSQTSTYLSLSLSIFVGEFPIRWSDKLHASRVLIVWQRTT